MFRVGFHWFKRIAGSRTPIVLGSLALLTLAGIASAKGPIVRVEPDLWAVFLASLVWFKGPIVR